MKKIIVIVISMFLLCSICMAEVKNVAVFKFDTKGGISADEADIVTELFIAELASKENIKVVDRSNFDKILREMKFQTSDWSDNAKTAQLGKALNATAVIRGQLMKTSGTIYMIVTLIDVKTAEVLSSNRERVSDISQIYGILSSFCEQIAKKIPESQGVEPIIGKWRALSSFIGVRYYSSRFHDYRDVNSFGIRFSWNEEAVTAENIGKRNDYADSTNTHITGELQIEFKKDGTLSISKLTYPMLDFSCPKAGKYFVNGKLSKEFTGSGYWKLQSQGMLDETAVKYKQYVMQIEIDGQNTSFYVVFFLNNDTWDVLTNYDYSVPNLVFQDVVTYPKTVRNNVGTSKRPEWKDTVLSEKLTAPAAIFFGNWIRID